MLSVNNLFFRCIILLFIVIIHTGKVKYLRPGADLPDDVQISPGWNNGADNNMVFYSLSISIEHLPEGMGRVFFFLPRILMVK